MSSLTQKQPGIGKLLFLIAWPATVYGSLSLLYVDMPHLGGLCGDWG